MNYNKHLEELQKFRDEIRDIQNRVEGLGVEVGNYIDEFEEIRDNAERRKIDPDFFDRNYPNTKKRSEDDVVDEAIQKRMKKIAGIL